MKLRKSTEADLKDYNRKQSLKLPSGKEMQEALEHLPDTPTNMLTADPPFGIGVSYHSRSRPVPPPPKPSELSPREAILTKAIEKAQAGGWMSEYNVTYDRHLGWAATLKAEPKQPKSGSGLAANVTTMLSENDILFDHDFAKALWGERRKVYDKKILIPVTTVYYANGYRGVRGDHYTTVPRLEEGWQYHLQQMVIADDPIQYLESVYGRQTTLQSR